MKLKQLKVRPKKIMEASPCLAEMGALFECWATAGVDDKRCTALAQSLTTCMGKPVQRTKHANTINYHLARLSRQL
ncbi:37S ribosomal protein mrp10, mitochondrial [Choanephora cucurbitarum]|uniref:37S ribosomal protein mrp10, mitochondrial n=1 Tax=Choanephora cucurbitarum TaxID=101091 RepID=A0A1C7N7S6_9FUNG|nr:37S ribosomal protein mrp10, mitochondrial [Choanephora cucurbitarum]